MLRLTHRSAAGAALVALAVFATACGMPGDGSGSRGTDDENPVAGDEVRVVDNAFEPEHTEVAAGETVTWVWDGRIPHNVAGDGFESDVQDSGTFSHTFEDVGTYEYRCTLHAGMTGTITVVDA